MREILIDEDSFSVVGEVHEFLARELGFPSYYGANLDALNDCLGDIDEPTAFTIFVASGVQEGEYAEWFPKLVRCLLRAAKENNALEVVVHADNFVALSRLTACPGLPALLEGDEYITQAVIACLK